MSCGITIVDLGWLGEVRGSESGGPDAAEVILGSAEAEREALIQETDGLQRTFQAGDRASGGLDRAGTRFERLVHRS